MIRCLLDVSVEKDSPCYYCCCHCNKEQCDCRCVMSKNNEEVIDKDCIHAC